MVAKRMLLSLFLFVAISSLYAQKTERFHSTIYIGVEPFMWVIGEKGGFIDYSITDKSLLQFSIAYQSWWWKNNEIQQFDNTYITDYLLASSGWVFRFSPANIVKKNEFSFSRLLLKPEFTYKHLSYDDKCFYSGSNGMNDNLRQLRSFKSNYFAFQAIIAHRHFGSSYEEIPVEWFIGPSLAIGFEEKNLISEGYSGNCTDVALNKITKETRFYYSIRFGLRFGFKIFESKN